MTDESKPCAATTKSGAACRNKAQPGSAYCYVHRDLAVKAASQSAPAPTEARPAQFNALVQELDVLANDLRAQIPEYTPPPFSPQALVALLKENLHRFTPEMQLDIVHQLKANLEGASPHDLIDPATWKGMWYILNYSIQSQSSALKDQITSRLSALPGVALLSDLRNNLEGTSPKDLLDLDTWKGAWYILNYSLKAQADDMKRKLLGGTE